MTKCRLSLRASLFTTSTAQSIIVSGAGCQQPCENFTISGLLWKPLRPPFYMLYNLTVTPCTLVERCMPSRRIRPNGKTSPTWFRIRFMGSIVVSGSLLSVRWPTGINHAKLCQSSAARIPHLSHNLSKLADYEDECCSYYLNRGTHSTSSLANNSG